MQHCARVLAASGSAAPCNDDGEGALEPAIWPMATPTKHKDCLTLLYCRQLWKHGNAVVFRNEAQSLQWLLHDCREDAMPWKHKLPRDDYAVATSWCNIFRPMY